MTERVLDIILTSFPKIILPGLLVTVPLTLISYAVGLLIAITTALLQVMQVKVLDQICRFYVWVFRGTPLLVQLFVIFYGLPAAGLVIPPLPSAIIAFSLNVGAYASETIRGAILAVPKDQKEACASTGMTGFQAMQFVILPQALKNSVPALFNTFISLVKGTSLAASITVTEMFMAAQRIVAVTYEPLILYLEVAVIYLIICTVLGKIQEQLESGSFKKKKRQKKAFRTKEKSLLRPAAGA